jgi:hypothetical protein
VKKSFATVAAMAEEIPEAARIGQIEIKITAPLPAEVTRAELHAFINAVTTAARELFHEDMDLSMEGPIRGKRAKR